MACLTANEVTALLASALARDEQSRVDAHLAACGECRELLDDVRDSLRDEDARASGPDLVGARIGGYRVVERIGRGGMGEIYRAEHPSLGTRVAVKVLRHDLASDPLAERRLVEEARAMALLDHPNVVRVRDLAALPDGRIYVVMDFLDGMALDAALARGGSFGPREAVAVAVQALEGLAAVHARGIVHRDVKPSNLFLSPAQDGTTRVVIVDFGLASRPRPGTSLFTQSNVVLGTPYYMAPEQIGRASRVDARADLYSLGAVLYHMLTGAPPFAARDLVDVLIDQRTRPPPRAPLAAVPEGVRAVVLCALEKERDARFADATAMRAALCAAWGAEPGFPAHHLPGLDVLLPGARTTPAPRTPLTDTVERTPSAAAPRVASLAGPGERARAPRRRLVAAAFGLVALGGVGGGIVAGVVSGAGAVPSSEPSAAHPATRPSIELPVQASAERSSASARVASVAATVSRSDPARSASSAPAPARSPEPLAPALGGSLIASAASTPTAPFVALLTQSAAPTPASAASAGSASPSASSGSADEYCTWKLTNARNESLRYGGPRIDMIAKVGDTMATYAPDAAVASLSCTTLVRRGAHSALEMALPRALLVSGPERPLGGEHGSVVLTMLGTRDAMLESDRYRSLDFAGTIALAHAPPDPLEGSVRVRVVPIDVPRGEPLASGAPLELEVRFRLAP